MMSREARRSAGLQDRPAAPVVLRIASGDRVGEYLAIDADRFTIGASTSCEVSFPEFRAKGLPRKAARIRREAEGWVLRHAGSVPMFLNSEPVDDKAPVRSGDIIRLSHDGPELQFLVQHQSQRTLRDIANDYAPEVLRSFAAAEPVDAVIVGSPPGRKAAAWNSDLWRRPQTIAIVAVAAAMVIAVAGWIVSSGSESPTPAPQDKSPSVSTLDSGPTP